MKSRLFWLAFQVGATFRLCPSEAESRQDARRHGWSAVGIGSWLTVFSEDVDLTVDEKLELMPALPGPGSLLWRPLEE